MALIKISSADVKTPSGYKVLWQDLDTQNSVRNESGVLTRERVRSGVYKIEAQWDNITKTELKTITDAITNVSFEVEFFDPTSSTQTTATMYAGDRNAEMVNSADAYTDKRWNFSVNLIEY